MAMGVNKAREEGLAGQSLARGLGPAGGDGILGTHGGDAIAGERDRPALLAKGALIGHGEHPFGAEDGGHGAGVPSGPVMRVSFFKAQKYSAKCAFFARQDKHLDDFSGAAREALMVCFPWL